jgi:hypothetical protein
MNTYVRLTQKSKWKVWLNESDEYRNLHWCEYPELWFLFIRDFIKDNTINKWRK